MGDNNLRQHLAKSLAVINLGSNDYLNNYLLPQLYPTSFIYNPKDFADLLISRYKRHLLVQYIYTSYHYLTLTFMQIKWNELCSVLYFCFFQDLQSLGLRKFLLGAIGPLGCIPNQLATGFVPPGQCRSYANDMVIIFNDRLKSLVDQLNADHSNNNGSYFVLGNTYELFSDIINHPHTYGKKSSRMDPCSGFACSVKQNTQKALFQ